MTQTTSSKSNIADAVLGLTSLGLPSPGSSAKSLSPSARASEAGATAAEISPASASPPHLTLPLRMPLDAAHMQPAAMAMNAPHPSARLHYMMTLPPPPPNGYGAVAPAGARPAAAAGFESLHQPILHPPHPSIPFSDPAMAMYRYSVAERMAAMDRAAAAVAPYSGYPYYLAPLPLPTQHQAAPIPNTKNFPETLFDVISRQEYAHIISWLPHGRGFIIHDKQRFANTILPRYFDGAKFTSFTRRLKRWSFVRVPRGPELGAYYNEKFMRDDPELVQKMIYKMEGQFEEGKKKTAGKNEQDRKMEDESDKEAEQVESLPKKEQAKTGKPPSLASPDQKLQQELHEPCAKIPSPNHKAAQAQAKSPSLMSLEQKMQQHTQIVHANVPAALPLPSMLPKRSKGCKKIPPTVHVSLQSTPHQTVAPHVAMATDPSSLQKVSPQLMKLNDPGDRCLMEAQRELLLARSMRAREDAAGMPVGPLGSASNIPRFRLGGVMTPRMHDVDRTLGLTGHHSGHPSAVTALPNHGLAGSSIQRGEIMDPAVTDLQMRLAPSVTVSQNPPQMFSSVESTESRSAILQREQRSRALSVDYHHLPKIPPRQLDANEVGPLHGVGLGAGAGTVGGRAIMMSQEEEDEFARFLVLKRKGGMAV